MKNYIAALLGSYFSKKKRFLYPLYVFFRIKYFSFMANREKKCWIKKGIRYHDSQSYSALIEASLRDGDIFSAAKIGTNEQYLIWLYFGCKIPSSKIDDIHNVAGVFPKDISFYEEYAGFLTESLKCIDYLGIWFGRNEIELYDRTQMKSELCDMSCISGSILGAAKGGENWFRGLKDKKIVVVSSFAPMMEARSGKDTWDKNWRNRIPFPEYKSVKGVLFPYGCEEEIQMNYKNSINLLKCFFDENEKTLLSGDIVLVSCGAYSIPVLAWLKKYNKSAIHMGGDLQLFFGIKGGRWDGADIYNENWVRPDAEFIPKKSHSIENGCYW